MLSIKQKLTKRISVIIIISCVITALVVAVFMYRDADNTINNSLKQYAQLGSLGIDESINACKNIARQVGSIKRLGNKEITFEEKINIGENQEEFNDFKNVEVIESNGIGLFEGENHSNEPYFTTAMKGDTYIEAPLDKIEQGTPETIVTAPLWKDGLANTEVIGVVYVIPNELVFKKAIDSIKLNVKCEAFLIDSSGNKIYSSDPEAMANYVNVIEAAKEDKSYKNEAEILTKMIDGEQGVSSYGPFFHSTAISYYPISNREGWSIGIKVDRTALLLGVYLSLGIALIILIAILLISRYIIRKSLQKIIAPLESCTDRINKLANGDLRSPVCDIHTNDEVETLSIATRNIVNNINSIINDVQQTLDDVNNKKMIITDRSRDFYVGDYSELRDNLDRLINTLNGIIKQISESVDQISIGITQVSDGAVLNSDGASKQATAIEDLTTAIQDITWKVSVTAKNTLSAAKAVENTNDKAIEGKSQMDELIESMKEISNKAAMIESINKLIQDISFQTNILSLNASVEAARAGAAGKGFAVVADEVRNLSQKSAKAANDTTRLINDTISAIENGTSKLNKTYDTFDGILSNISAVNETVKQVAKDTDEQSESIKQIDKAVTDISGVIQTNSSTAQETAACSEEVSSQTTIVKSITDEFITK